MPRSAPVPLILVAAHLAAGGVLVWLIDAGIGGVSLQIIFDALIYADATLVGFWAGLGRHSKAAGYLGVGAAVLAMAAFVFGALWHSISGPLGPGNDIWVTLWLWLFQLALTTLSMAVVMAALVWLRRRGVELRLDSPADASDELPPIRFSLRQLFLLTLVAGVMLKLGPVARAHLNDYRSYLSSVVALATGGVCLGGVGLAGLWAIFGGRASAARLAVACLIAAVLGLFPPYYFPALHGDDFLGTVAVTITQLVIVISTLAILRARGYRLGRPAP